MIKQQLEKLDPKKKRLLAIVGGAGVLIGGITLFSDGAGNNGPQNRARSADDAIRHVLTDRDTRELTFESLASQLKAAERQNKELQEDVNNLRIEVQSTDSSGVPSQVARELDSLSRELDLIREENRELREITAGVDFSGVQAMNQPEQETPETSEDDDSANDTDISPEPPPTQGPSAPEPIFNEGDGVNAEEVFQRAPVRRPTAAEGEGEEGENTPRGLRITSYYQQEEANAGEAEEPPEPPVYIPAGSVVSGVLLNGMDAPTNQGSRRDPFPSTIRVKHEAILPNRFSADISECFLIVSGYGDLSSERAYLRGETLSCVTNDKDIIEVPMEGYAVGEDGKSGIRGRLVSKQGAIIARSMIAGFFSGASKAFDVSPVPFIQTGDADQGQQYESNFSPELAEGAASSGASQALDRVAQFYVEMAESIFPVIEIDAGRSVDVILTSGAELTIRDAENP